MRYFHCLPGGSLSGRLTIPGDKSISHRAIMLSSIAEGESHISGFLQGEDSLNTIRAFRAMGVAIQQLEQRIIVQGVGPDGLQAPEHDLEMGNSGTAMRLLLGLLAGQRFSSVLVGDASLSSRPMERVIKPLRQMGARIDSDSGYRAPLRVDGDAHLKAIEYHLPMASAQVKSCLLLAGLFAEGDTVVWEPAPTRDHSERMLRDFGCEISKDGAEIRMRGRQFLKARDINIPADISSAAFFIVAASIAKNSEITLQRIGVNPTRTGVIEILKRMGAAISLSNQYQSGGEPVADITVRSSDLRGIQIPESLVPLAIDEFPAILIAAACAKGETILTGAEELRVKESDRIQAMAENLHILGIHAVTTPDGIRVTGGELGGGELDSHGDHRIAMALSMAALRASSRIEIRNCENVGTSFPGFADLAASAGLRINDHG